MPYSFLQVVNKVLRETREIAGDQSELTSFNDSARQARINVARQSWIKAIQELFDLDGTPVPEESKTATITLVEGTALNDWGRVYTLPTDLIIVRFPLINESNGYTIKEYCGGFEAMRKEQLQPRNYKGRPEFGCIDPEGGQLRVDVDPDSSAAGLEYVLYYDRYIKPFHEFDTLPFDDNVADAMVDVVAQLYNRKMKQTFDIGAYNESFARAARQLSREQVRDRW